MNKNVWDQIKGVSCDNLIKAIEKDGFEMEDKSGAVRGYYNPIDKRRITIHYHPGKTFGPKLLKNLIADLGWTAKDMKRLKLIK